MRPASGASSRLARRAAVWDCPVRTVLLFSVDTVTALSQVKVIHVGSTVMFSCNTTQVDNVLWEFTSASYSPETETLAPVVWEQPNNYSINNVQLCHAGAYRCSYSVDDHLRTDYFELIILGESKRTQQQLWFSLSMMQFVSYNSGRQVVQLTRQAV